MSTAIPSFNQAWEMSGAPTSSFVIAYGVAFVGDTVRNTVTGDRYVFIDFSDSSIDPISGETTYSNAVFQQIVTNSNIASLIPDAADWTQASVSLAFNTARTPSSTQNVTVIGSFSQSSTVLTAAVVNAQVNISGSWVTVGTASLSGLLTTQVNSITFDVPKSAQYRFISASGSNTINLIIESYK